MLATAISTVIAVVLGALSGSAPVWLDSLLMRLTEILLSVPNLLLVVLLQAILGTATVWSISLVIGADELDEHRQGRAHGGAPAARQRVCSRSEVHGRRAFSTFSAATWRRIFCSSIMFMVVMNVRSAMIAESTLSFMGIGLPLEVISWGSMLSLAEKALLTNAWWIIVIPGVFLVVTLLCMTNIGHDLRRRANHRHSNL